jgi:hypothetical protein
MLKAKKNIVCVQTIYCIKDTIYHFLMTYLLLNTINFTRSGICLSEDFKPLPQPTGRASHVDLFSLSTAYSLPTISSSLWDLFKGVSFNSIAVKNRIIEGCMQKVSLVKLASQLFLHLL